MRGHPCFIRRTMSRIFLIGNGKSATPEALNLLVSENCMGVNRIGLIYPYTRWRPNYYYKTDYTIGQNWLPEIMSHVLNAETCLLWDAFKNGADPLDINHHFISDGIGDTYPHVSFVPRCSHVFDGTGTWDDDHLCLGLNSALGMTQWAFELRFSEIYLLGFDGNYNLEQDDHCVPNYYDRKMDHDYVSRNNEKTMAAHELIHEKCPVMVYNCSEISVFKMHPYRDLKKVLNDK